MMLLLMLFDVHYVTAVVLVLWLHELSRTGTPKSSGGLEYSLMGFNKTRREYIFTLLKHLKLKVKFLINSHKQAIYVCYGHLRINKYPL